MTELSLLKILKAKCHIINTHCKRSWNPTKLQIANDQTSQMTCKHIDFTKNPDVHYTYNEHVCTKKKSQKDLIQKVIVSLSVAVTYIIWIIFDTSLPPDVGSTKQDLRISNPETPTSSTHIARRINWSPTKVQNWRLEGNRSQSSKLLRWKCNIFSETIVL